MVSRDGADHEKDGKDGQVNHDKKELLSVAVDAGVADKAEEALLACCPKENRGAVAVLPATKAELIKHTLKRTALFFKCLFIDEPQWFIKN